MGFSADDVGQSIPERFEQNVAGHDSLLASDVMISDWSGAALEYAFGLEKPVLFIDMPKKINNPEHDRIDCPPLANGLYDNCPAFNPAQIDRDGDLCGDECDGCGRQDLNGDGIVDP